MRIKELVAEQTEVDEGIVSDIGKGVGKAVGATARGVGAVAGGVRGAWDAAKSGFQTGRHYVSGQGTPGAPAHYYDYQGPNTTTLQGPGGQNQAAPGGPDPKALRAQAAELSKQADQLEKQQNATPTPPQAGQPAAGAAGGQPTGATSPQAGQTQAPAPSKVSYSGMAAPNQPAALPQATSGQGAYSVKGQQTAAASAAPKPAAPNFGGGQTQGSAPSKVGYSSTPQPKSLPQATSAPGAANIKTNYAGMAAPKPAAPNFGGGQTQAPKISMPKIKTTEGFRSNFLGQDL